jgi:hypothetical protein
MCLGCALGEQHGTLAVEQIYDEMADGHRVEDGIEEQGYILD